MRSQFLIRVAPVISPLKTSFHIKNPGKALLPGMLFIAILWLAGCTSMPADLSEKPVTVPPETSALWLEQRKQQLAAITHWRLNARFSLVTENEAWSGKLDWLQQSNKEYLIHFSDPAGQGAMQLVGNDQEVELQLANGDSYRAQDADTLLKRETDWQLPINSLWYWVRGLPDPAMTLKTQFNGQNLPVSFEQDKWTVNFHGYHHVDQQSFPRKITVEKEAFKLKLIIMDWMVRQSL